MRPLALRRVPAGLAALAFVLAWAVPAQAAAKAKVDFYVKNSTLAPGSSANIATLLFADRTLPVAGGAVSLRYRFVNQDPAFRLQEAGHPNNCSVALPDNVELSCSAAVTALTPAGVDSAVVGFIEIADNGVPGTQGTLTATMTVKGYAPVTRTARVTIGEAIGLTAVEGDRMRSVKPGAVIDTPMTITNSGTVAVQGVGFSASGTYAFESRTQFSNCLYTDGAVIGCTFDQTLEPGQSYRLTLPLRVRADTFAPDVQGETWSWRTDEEIADQRQWVQKGGYGAIGTPGRGGVLRLTPVAAAKAGKPQALPGSVWHSLKLDLTGKNSADIAAAGATVSGKKGAVVTVPVGLRNRGPAAIDGSQGNGGWLDTWFYVPKGTTAVRVPDRCSPMDAHGKIDPLGGGAPGSQRYSCALSSLLKVGGTVKFEFGLRIDQVISGARGAVVVGADAHAGELNPANNRAAVIINPAGAAAPGGDGGQGGGGGLPITGPQSALFGAIGLLLVLGGAAAVLLSRRGRVSA